MCVCASCTPRPVALMMIFYGFNFPADAVVLSDGIGLISGLIGLYFATVALSPACVSVLAAFQLVQSGWGQPELPGWGSVVYNTEIKGAVGLEELIFPPAPPFGGK